MKIALLLAFVTSLGLAQVSQRPDYMGPFFQSLSDSVDVATHVRDSELANRALELRRDEARLQEDQARRQAHPEMLTYREVHPDKAEWQINQDYKDAVNTCRALHDDCLKLDGMMNVIAGVLRPDWTKLTLTEYVECLYAVAKTASFGEQARAALSKPATPAKTDVPH